MTDLQIRYIEAKKAVMRRDFSRMNDAQREAVFTTEGPLLILAGAGSGKTTVLINRAANLLKYGRAYHSDYIPFDLSDDDVSSLERYANGDVSGAAAENRATELIADAPPKAWQLMAITFTNKAAGELKERLSAMLGDEGADVWAMTFHATCARMLRRDADRLGYDSKFTIYDTDDQKRLIKAAMSELNVDEKTFNPKMIISEISHAKDSMVTAAEYESKAGSDFRLKKIAQIYSLYQKKLRDGNAMDFDDLLFNTVLLLENNEDVREYYQKHFRYIMVDEYQDTNHAQYRMVRLLADGRRNLCVVGDDDQSIYKFRGATIENILGFEKSYPDAKVIRLEQNYRSTQTILDAANSVIANNKGRHSKRLWTDNGEGGPVVVYSAADERKEAEFISDTINEYVGKGGKYSDCAVLYRANSLSSPIENHMMRAGIPYRVVAGHKFYDRKEIRDAIAYLSVVNNPSDEVRLSRIINEPKRGIGERSVDTAAEIAAALGISVFEVLGTADQFASLSRSANKLMAFYNMMCEFIEAANDPDVGLADLLDLVLDKSGYTESLINDERAQDRLENLQELASTMMRYEEEHGEDTTLGGYLEDVALITDIDAYDADTDCVSLMTLHAAKGLEFPVVFMPGVEEGIFPNMASMLDPAEIEEDRRLAYVGITRAKKQLYISHAESRILYGQTQRYKLSRYVGEIDGRLIEHRGLTRRADSASASDFTDRRMDSIRSAQAASRVSVGGSASGGSFRPGERVKHRVFGEGTVLAVSPMGSDTLLEIDFDKVGRKKLMANFAGLKKV